MKHRQIKYIFLISLLTLGSISCASTRYYLQSVNGHIDIHTKKQPISAVLVAEETDEILQGKLKMIVTGRFG